VQGLSDEKASGQGEATAEAETKASLGANELHEILEKLTLQAKAQDDELKAHKIDLGDALKTVVIQEDGKPPRTLIELPPGISREQIVKALHTVGDPEHNPSHGKVGWSAEAKGILDEKESTHLWILQSAIRIMQGQPSTVDAEAICKWLKWGPKSSAQTTTTPYPDNTIFHDALCKGLWDADHVNPWYNSMTWQSHFYSTKTQMSYSSMMLQCNWPYSSNAYRFASKALDHMVRLYNIIIENTANTGTIQYYVEFFYYCGIFLHYFTDQTQPMHAHNFPDMVAGTNDHFHSEYEAAAQAYINTDPAALKVTPGMLNDSNAYNFGGLATTDPIQLVDGWVVNASKQIGWENYNLALTDTDGTNWSLGPATNDGKDPVPCKKNLDAFYADSIFSSSQKPAGYSTWQESCKPVWNRTLVAAQEATYGVLKRMFGLGGIFSAIMFKGTANSASSIRDPHGFDTKVRQVPASLSVQTFYLPSVGAANIYTNQRENECQIFPGSSDSSVMLGSYAVTICIDKSSNAIRSKGAPQVCEEMRTSADNVGNPMHNTQWFGKRIYGGPGTVIATRFVQGASFANFNDAK